MFGVPRRVVAVGLVVLLRGGGIASLPVAATADHGAVTGARDGAAAGVGENCTQAETASGRVGRLLSSSVADSHDRVEARWSGFEAPTARRQPRGQGGDTAGTAAPAAASMETGTATSGATRTGR